MSAGLEYLKITSDEVVAYVPTLNSIQITSHLHLIVNKSFQKLLQH